MPKLVTLLQSRSRHLYCLCRRAPSSSVSSNGEDLFIHQSSIRSEGYRSLDADESVELEIEIDNNGGSKAINVSGPDDAPVQGNNGGGGPPHHRLHNGAFPISLSPLLN